LGFVVYPDAQVGVEFELCVAFARRSGLHADVKRPIVDALDQALAAARIAGEIGRCRC
jgi:hypothetical protein